MTVEFDVFSGKPNPVWDLSPALLLELQEASSKLPTFSGPVPTDGLGYRGFVINTTDLLTGGLATPIHIFSGLVMMADGHSYRDVHGIEHRLLLQASQHGYKSIVDNILQGQVK